LFRKIKSKAKAALGKSAALRIKQQKKMILKKIEAAKKRQARVQAAKQQRAKAQAKVAKQKHVNIKTKSSKHSKGAAVKKTDPLDELFGSASKKSSKSGSFEDLFGSSKKSDDDILDF